MTTGGKVKPQQSILAWHFITEDRMLANDMNQTKAAKGLKLHVDPPIIPCVHGLHGSIRIIDAIKYAPGPIICRVQLSGEIVAHGTPTDKYAASDREILWGGDATMILHEFACRCAEQALALIKDPDPRSIAAITAKRAWMRGEITDQQLAAASAAASAAAWAAARDAAMDAAKGAARDAAWDAASAAAWDAARAAPWDAARAAAWAAARDAARDAQNEMLESMVIAARPK